MIEFREKKFAAPMLIGLLGTTGASIGISSIQSGVHHKQDAEQQEEFNSKMEAEQKKQNAALNRIADQAAKNPALAQQAAGVIVQKSYAAPSGNFLKKAGTVVYDFARNLNKAGEGNQVVKKIGTGLGMGAAFTGTAYAADKLIQADRKKLTGAPIEAQENPIEKKKKLKKAAIKTGITAGLLTAGVLAARKGALGKGFEKLSNRGWKTVGNKPGWDKSVKEIASGAGKSFKESFIPGKGEGMGKWVGPGLTYAFPAITIGTYALGERKQLKQQAAQQKQYAENYQYQNESKKPGSVLKKIGIGALATAGTVALTRRVGPAGIRKNINEMYMTYGNKIAGKNGNKVGNWMMKSGAEHYGKAQAKLAQKAPAAALATGQDAAAIGNARLKEIQSGTSRGRKLGDGLLSGVSKFWTGANGEEVTGFLGKMAKDKRNSKETRAIADWLGKHKRAALVGSIGVGSVAFAPFGWSDKAVRGATRVVDKNSFAYEKSQNQQI